MGRRHAGIKAYLDDHQIPIRSNLQTIVAQMVAENRQDWFFIDTLCINQDDDAEKPFLVSIMGEIYQRAEEVLAWIVQDPDQCESNAEKETDDTAVDSEDWVILGSPTAVCRSTTLFPS